MIEAVGQIQQGVAALAEFDFSSLTGEQLGELVVAMEKIKAQLAAQGARAVRAFDLSGEWSTDGSRNAAAWIGRRANVNPAQARAGTRMGRRLAGMPLTAAALAGGEISEQHANQLGKLAHSRRTLLRENFAEWEEELVDKARTMHWNDFREYLNYWKDAADPDGAEAQANDDHEARHANLSATFEGRWRLDGWFDPIGGTELATALERIYQDLLADDWVEARARCGDNAVVDDLARDPGQRRADAFVEMARRAMAAPIGARLPEPLITVLVDYDTLKGRVLELLNNGTVLTPGQAASLLPFADVERVVYAGGSRKICDLGRRTRFFRGALRRVVEIRDRHCTFPGCDRPAEQCDIDHVQTWADDGETSQANGRLRCGPHNRNRGPEDPNGNPIDTDDVWDAAVLWTNGMVTPPANSSDAGS